MNSSGIFIFGSKLFEERKLDAISSLPLEMSWKIFSYLDDASLRRATRVNAIWRRIILSNKNFRKQINIFEKVLMFGSRNLVDYCGKIRRRPKKKSKNYLPMGEITVRSTNTVTKRKRVGDDMIVYSKRFKLH